MLRCAVLVLLGLLQDVSAGYAERIWTGADGRIYARSGLRTPAGSARATLGLSGRAISRVVAVPGGQIVRLSPVGVDVIGNDAIARIDDRGDVRYLVWSAVPAATGSIATSAEQAIARARRSQSIRGRLRSMRPVLWAADDGVSRAALRLDFGFDPMAGVAPVVIVDGQTGRVLASDPGVRYARPQADVFAVSPAENAELSRVTLHRLDEGAATLANSSSAAMGCLDTRSCREISPGVVRHACTITATAQPDSDGNFLYPYTGDHDPSDTLPEVMAFFHIEQAMGYLEELGLGPLLDQPITAITNYRQPNGQSAGQCSGGQYSGDGELAAFDNAFFTRTGEEITTEPIGPALIFGQGRTIDFALDGDVIVHELGHAITYALVPDWVRSRVDRFGTDVSPAALHEAYSDVLALLVHGSPVLGDYVGSGFGSGEPVRDLSEPRRCPDDLTGNAHRDGRIFGSAIYAARSAIAGDAPERGAEFDRAVVGAWAALPDHAGFEHAGAITVMELELVLGAEAAALAEQIFVDHGLLGCGARVVDGATGKAFSTLPGLSDLEAGGQQPGPFQLRYQLTESAQALVLDVQLFDSYAIEPEQRRAMAVVKPGEQPIEWQPGPPGTWHGDHTGSADLVVDGDRHARAVIPGPFGPGVYHLMLVNQGAVAELHHTRVGFMPTDQPADCGCSSASGGSVPLAIVLLGWLLQRRRRR